LLLTSTPTNIFKPPLAQWTPTGSATVFSSVLAPLLPLHTFCVDVISLESSTPFKLVSIPEFTTIPPVGQATVGAVAADLKTGLGAPAEAVLALPPPPQAESKTTAISMASAMRKLVGY
jgi:hypothetical protein